MRAPAPVQPVPEVYTVAEVARAAGVPERDVRILVETGRVYAIRGLIPQPDAIHLVRRLTGRTSAGKDDRMPLTLIRASRRRGGRMSLATSGLLHAAFAALLVIGSALGWARANDTEERLPREKPVRLVFLQSPGPGGGGGGGGLKMPAPPPQAQRKAPEPKKIASPVPPVRRVASPPRPPVPRRPPPSVVIPPSRPRPDPILPTLALAPAVNAPVVPLESDQLELAGLPDPPKPSAQPSAGPGTGGGIGSGHGAGLGEGDGGGIGSGSGGGTGGGPYRPGSGIEPPLLLREVRASYTAEARRRAIEGDVVLEIVVRRDGVVSNVRLIRSLGAGLDEKAVEAVRQWRFAPARRQGQPVDVVVTVSVAFSLR